MNKNQSADSFGYGHGCMMTVANSMAYIPLGEGLPAVHLLHSGKATEGMVPLPVGEDGEGTEVSIQEVILADTVTGLERTRSVAEVGVRTHDEAVCPRTARGSLEGGGEQPVGNTSDADCGTLEIHEGGSIPGPPTEARLESSNRRVVEADQCTSAGVRVSDCVWGR